MKKLSLIAVGILFATVIFAVDVPTDPEVKVGVLPNGLTYYIRHNAEPKDQANFYIAQKVGSILEEESQRGLAHFLEHMCFNGTQHFPGNGVIQYCQRIGVSFGADLNAYTSVDETVYNIDHVPTTTPGAMDSCLYILHDWADGLLLTDEDIDHERGVIHEEWRTRSNAQIRQYEKFLPVIFPNNRYAERMPIGLMSVVDSFPYQVLRNYYEKWYRPDLQGIIVVGDVDVDEIEQKIINIFSPITMPANPAERTYIPIEDNNEPIVSITTDPEQTYATTFLFLKHDAFPQQAKNTFEYLVYKYAMNIAVNMLNSRLSDITEQPNAPFSYAGVTDGDFFIARTKQAWMGIMVGDETRLTEAAQLLYRETLRAIRSGFTEGEYERARAEYLSQVESAYNARDKKSSKEYCQEIVRHFIDNEPMLNPEQEYVLSQQIAPNIPIETINQMIGSVLSDSTNLVMVSMLPEKDGVTYPTVDALRATLRAVEAEQIEAYVDKPNNEPLISQLPKAGKIKKQEDAAFGYKLLTLKNGVKVYIRHTDYNKDEVLLRAYSLGGSSRYEESEALNLKVASEVCQLGGLGQFSTIDLRKALSGKNAAVSPNIRLFNESLSGSAAPKDLETLFQLCYLQFTAMREDTAAFRSWQQRTYAMQLNQEKEPLTSFQDSLNNTLFSGNPRVTRLTAEEVMQIDYNRCMQIARERFANAADFTFIITGAYDEAVLLPLIEQYLGSLPADKKRLENYRDVGVHYAKGCNDNIFSRPMQVPMSTICYMYSGPIAYTQRNILASRLISDVLGIVCTEEIREKEGGTYYVITELLLDAEPEPEAFFEVFYQTDPARYEYLNSRIEAIMENFATNGPSQENLDKCRETMLKRHREALNENSYYQDVLERYLRYNINSHDDYEQILNSITPAELQQLFSNLLKCNNRTRVILNGVAEN